MKIHAEDIEVHQRVNQIVIFYRVNKRLHLIPRYHNAIQWCNSFSGQDPVVLFSTHDKIEHEWLLWHLRLRESDDKSFFSSQTWKLHFSTGGQNAPTKWSLKYKKVSPWNVSIFVHWPCHLITDNFNHFFPFEQHKKIIMVEYLPLFVSYHQITYNNRKINGTTKMVLLYYLLVRSSKV